MSDASTDRPIRRLIRKMMFRFGVLLISGGIALRSAESLTEQIMTSPMLAGASSAGAGDGQTVPISMSGLSDLDPAALSKLTELTGGHGGVQPASGASSASSPPVIAHRDDVPDDVQRRFAEQGIEIGQVITPTGISGPSSSGDATGIPASLTAWLGPEAGLKETGLGCLITGGVLVILSLVMLVIR